MMGTKTVALTEDAYRRLARLKKEGESFSKVIQRLTGRQDLLRFAGSISKEFAARLRSASHTARDRLAQEERERRGTRNAKGEP